MTFGYAVSVIQSLLMGIFNEVNNSKSLRALYAQLLKEVEIFEKVAPRKNPRSGSVQLVRIFSCVFAIASHRSVNICLEPVLEEHYPGICPHCGEIICLGEPQCDRSTRVSQDVLLQYHRVMSEIDPQIMFINIYGCDKTCKLVDFLHETVRRLGEEIDRALLADRLHPQFQLSFKQDLADTLAYLFRLSNLVGLNLVCVAEKRFSRGVQNVKRASVCAGSV